MMYIFVIRFIFYICYRLSISCYSFPFIYKRTPDRRDLYTIGSASH